jgi:carbon storage regulator
MLVLTRRVDETIVIAGDIRVTVVAVQGDKVRLGIVAPEAVTVDREEIHQRRGGFAEPARLATREATRCGSGPATVRNWHSTN